MSYEIFQGLKDLYNQFCTKVFGSESRSLEASVSSVAIVEQDPVFAKIRRLNNFSNGYRTGCPDSLNPLFYSR